MPERFAATATPEDQTKELRRFLGVWLKERRQDAGLTQAELADILGLRYHSFVSQVENGIGRIPQNLYRTWADALRVEPLIFAMTVLKHVEPGLHTMITPYCNASSIPKRRRVSKKKA